MAPFKTFKPACPITDSLKIKSVRDCCEIPYYKFNDVEQKCFNESRLKYQNRSGSEEFLNEVTRCYMTRTNLLTPNGEIDTKVVKEIYRNFSNLVYVTYGEYKWDKAIDGGIENCKAIFSPGRSLYENFYYFYGCMNEYLLSYCAIIIPSDECRETLVEFEKCTNFVPKCEKWQVEIMMPEFCCNYPPLITEKLKQDYRLKCQPEIQHRKIAKCVKQLIDKKFKPTGKYDFSEIKATLSGNVNNSNPRVWDSVIENTVEASKTFIEGLFFF